MKSNAGSGASSCRRGMARREFMAGAAAFTAASILVRGARVRAAPDLEGRGLTELSVREMAELVRKRSVTAVELVEAHLQRIEEVNPRINAVVTLAADRALAEARRADEMLASGKVMGPLHGVPFTIKDSLETEGVRSTAGTLGRAFHVPDRDATVVARVRAAGGILLGKSNTPEFTMGGGGRGTVNLLFGTTRNPYNLEHSPAGSSGGAGAIVAACGAAFDIGSDLGGSVRGPCHANGIAGIKPTSGRTPRTGHVPGYGGLFDSWQQLGPMARRVEDVELLMSIICGEDMEDAFCFDVPLGSASDVRIDRLRIAFYTDNGVMTPTLETQRAVREAAAMLREAGAAVTEDIHPGYRHDYELAAKARAAEGGCWQQRLLDRYGTDVPDPGLAARITGEFMPTPEFLEVMEEVDHSRSRMLHWMRNYDAILCPVNARPAPKLSDTPEQNSNYTRIYNATGWPAAVVRGGWSPDGLPIGVQVVGHPWRDDIALAIARVIESNTGGWRKPTL